MSEPVPEKLLPRHETIWSLRFVAARMPQVLAPGATFTKADMEAAITADDVRTYVWLQKNLASVIAVTTLMQRALGNQSPGLPRGSDADRARVALVSEHTMYEQHIRQLERGEITADFPIGADAAMFRRCL
jgi:alpha-D-ribose 1-methylphosphonate 5-triphosphate synthase subunit PhnH